MPKRRKPEEIIRNETIVPAVLEEVLVDSMMPYSEYVLLERALPRVEDGLKPVQRRILYTMMELGNTPDKPYKKSARVAGDTMGKYHPHGDTSIYDAMVRMAQDFSMREVLVDGHGNFGSVDGDSAAAMRYTEVRMAPLALEMLRDLEKDTVDWRLNFDDSLKEPQVLPGRFPNLLVNGATGIAVGLATNIPTHNLKETVDAVVYRMQNPKCSLDDVMKILPGPDFPTGGLIVGREGIREAYETGKGKITIRSLCEIEEAPGGKSLIAIHEIPFQENKARMLERILKLSEEQKDILGGISDIRDESDRNGMRAVIEIRKGADAKKILQYLYRYSNLEVSYGINMVAIADGRPQQLGLIPLLDAYIGHQRTVLTRRSRFELEQAEAREHILEGLIIAVDNIDEVIRIIRRSANTREAQRGLMARFDLTGIQAQAILDMRLARLTNLEVEKLEQELAEVRKTIANLRAILRSKSKLDQLIIKELTAIRNAYGAARRTKIVDAEKLPVFKAEDYVVTEDVAVILTSQGYIKRLPAKTYQRSQRESEIDDLSPTDAPIALLMTDTSKKVMIFTEDGVLLQIAVSDIPEARWREKGPHLSTVISSYPQGSNCVAMLPMSEKPDKDELLFITAQGMGKKSAEAEYQTRQRRIAACSLKEGDRLVAVERAKRGTSLIFVTKKGMVLSTRHTQIPVQGRATRGVKSIDLEPDDEVIWAGQCGAGEELLLMTDTAYVRRVAVMDLPSQNRGGKGSRAILFYKNGANGTCLVYGRPAADGDIWSLTQASGASVRLETAALANARSENRGSPTDLLVMGDPIQRVYKLIM